MTDRNAQPVRKLGDDAHIVVAGAGSIGCFAGGLLTASGRRVTFLAREKVIGEVAQHGLRITDLQGLDRRLDPGDLKFTSDLAALSEAAIVLVTVKSRDTAALADEIAKRCPVNTVVVSLQNGVDNADVLRNACAPRTVLGGMVAYNVLHAGEGRFHRGTAGKIVIEAGRDDVLDILRVPSLAVAATPDIAGVQWGKLLLNLNNALNALSGIPLRDQFSDRGWRRLLADQMTEGLSAMARAGIKPVAATPVSARMLPWVLRLPNALFRRAAKRMLQIDPEARSSMWEDLMRGRPTEVGYLQGAIVRLGQKHGLEAKLCARISNLVKDAEAKRAGSPGLSPRDIRQ